MTAPVPTTSGDRRPLASRDTTLARRASEWLIARSVAPNAISAAGMFAGIAAGALLAATAWWPDGARACWFAAALLVQARLVCNLLDGMVAIGSGTTSPVGELWNEVPDRVSDSAILIGLGFAAGGEPWLGFVAASFAMATAYVRALGRAAGTGSDFRGPMAKPQRMFAVTLVALFLAVAPPTWWPADLGAGLPAVALAVIAAGAAWTAVRRLRTIAQRLRGGVR